MSSDESLDSLPSPGFVSVFWRRHPSNTEREGEADGGADGAVGGEADEGEGEAEEGEGEPEEVEGEALDEEEALDGGEAVDGGEEVGTGEEVDGGAVEGGGEAEHRPLPSTAWSMEALRRRGTHTAPVLQNRSGVG